MTHTWQRLLILLAALSLLGLAGCDGGKKGGDKGGDKAAKGADKGKDKSKDKDKPAGDKADGDKPAGDKTAGDKTAGDKPDGDKPAGDKPAGDKPAGDTPAGDKPGFGEFAKDSPEQKAADELLVAMKEMSSIMNANAADAKKTITEVKAYLDKHDAKLKAAIATVRKRYDAMERAEQDAYQEKQTQRPEYKAWAMSMDTFEEKYPDDFGELEELMDKIQSTGAAKDTIVDEDKKGGDAAPPEEKKEGEAAPAEEKKEGEAAAPAEEKKDDAAPAEEKKDEK